MAIDNESKRASVLNAGSFYPGRIPYLTEPSGSNLNSKAQRGAVLHHYFGIDADTPGGADVRNHIIPAYMRINA